MTAAPFCIMGKYYEYEDMKDTVCNLNQAITIRVPDHHPGMTNYAECKASSRLPRGRVAVAGRTEEAPAPYERS